MLTQQVCALIALVRGMQVEEIQGEIALGLRARNALQRELCWTDITETVWTFTVKCNQTVR